MTHIAEIAVHLIYEAVRCKRQIEVANETIAECRRIAAEMGVRETYFNALVKSYL